ncbi:MAG: glycosyltransferase family 39 protein, partial [Anaerolinea sp.]|nr:glycosyltransferase family 39 protein [Anaerolinea sp.]
MKPLAAPVRASWLVCCLTLLGFALRVYDINGVSLRGDEAFTVIHWIREPLSHTLQNIATVDPQPPLAYFSFWLWGQIVGDSEFLVRFLPALVNVIGVPVAFVLGKHLFGSRVGLLSALFWAISPTQIWHAQDARNYALWSAANALSLWLALRVIDRADAHRDRLVDWGVFLLAASLSGYLYYLELFTIAALNLFVLICFFPNRRLLVRWFSGQFLLGLALAVWYFQERLLIGSGYGGTAGGFELGRIF